MIKLNKKGYKMRCDLCRQQTPKNYFSDDFTILCADCARNSGIKAGKEAAEYIRQKSKNNFRLRFENLKK